ncbi:MAG: SDR family oxidoreductase [Pseudomonadota bacterium]
MEVGRALVTGAGARLGRAMAEALGQAGWAVALHYNSSAAGAEETEAAITAAGGRAVPVQADLSDPGDVAGLMAKARGGLGGEVTLLVNSASTFVEDTLASHGPGTWATHFDVNLRAPIALAQALAAELPGQTPGLVVNIIDQRVWKLTPQFFTYTLSKSALWTATRTMAQALAPHIRVNAIGPGPTLKSVHQTEAEFAAEQAATLTGRGAGPGDVTRALLYLIEADAMTGQMLAVDGGQHLLWQTPDVAE